MKPYPKDPRYLVTKDGRVFSTISNKFLKPGKSSNGYLTVRLWTTGKGVSHLIQDMVLHTYVEEKPKGSLTLHRNDKKQDNRLVNLYYGSRSDNHHDRTRNGARKFSPSQVRKMRKLYANGGITHKEIAEKFGGNDIHIGYIIRGEQYASIK